MQDGEMTAGVQGASRGLERAARELLDCLAKLQALLQELGELAEQKLDAMRRADAAALQQRATREFQVLEQVLQVEQERHAILARLAQGLPSLPAVTMRLREIADHLPEPFSSTLRARSLGLREKAEFLEKKNRLVASVARSLQGHLRTILDELASANQESLVYGRDGKRTRSATRTWIDAVG